MIFLQLSYLSYTSLCILSESICHLLLAAMSQYGLSHPSKRQCQIETDFLLWINYFKKLNQEGIQVFSIILFVIFLVYNVEKAVSSASCCIRHVEIVKLSKWTLDNWTSTLRKNVLEQCLSKDCLWRNIDSNL